MTAEEQFACIERNLADAREILRRLAIIAEQNEERSTRMMDTFNRMGRILQIHEQRSA